MHAGLKQLRITGGEEGMSMEIEVQVVRERFPEDAARGRDESNSRPTGRAPEKGWNAQKREQKRWEKKKKGKRLCRFSPYENQTGLTICASRQPNER